MFSLFQFFFSLSETTEKKVVGILEYLFSVLNSGEGASNQCLVQDSRKLRERSR